MREHRLQLLAVLRFDSGIWLAGKHTRDSRGSPWLVVPSANENGGVSLILQACFGNDNVMEKSLL